uniref:Uncharacterized protein n=1 Tax=Rhizophora mucronata TaxID=61149 RepID=A0A2P2NNN4_RHIMU
MGLCKVDFYSIEHSKVRVEQGECDRTNPDCQYICALPVLIIAYR